jgi:hypothetical protein
MTDKEIKSKKIVDDKQNNKNVQSNSESNESSMFSQTITDSNKYQTGEDDESSDSGGFSEFDDLEV